MLMPGREKEKKRIVFVDSCRMIGRKYRKMIAMASFITASPYSLF